MSDLPSHSLFDCHFHIIDPRFPLLPNQGYIPLTFTTRDYLQRMKDYDLRGGAVVSGSFQAFDQSYLVQTLKDLGSGFVGVTQLPAETEDDEILALNQAGVRAVRFNLKRGGSAGIKDLDTFARRVHDLAGWHTELYVDSIELADLAPTLSRLPTVSIDHLGLSKTGLHDLYALVEKGGFVKATGFGRVDFDVATVIKQITSINPDALMFGTDLPSTRAPVPYADQDSLLVTEILDEHLAGKVLCDNARAFYRIED